ncbi:MAG: NAD(P)/FAD-dependent oxidoreductase [Actinomycetes bacterium]
MRHGAPRPRQPQVDVDVLVVGAGPVGLVAAIDARLRGFSVLLVDPRLPQRPGVGIGKACGEGLMPVAVRELHRLGLTLDGGIFRGIRYVDGSSGQAVRAALPSPGLGVEREVLSAALLRRAGEVGVELRHARCTGLRAGTAATSSSQAAPAVATLTPATGGDTLETGETLPDHVRARWVLAADGLHSPVRRLLQVPMRRVPVRRWGVHEHLTMAPWSSDVEVYWGRTTEAYVTPLSDQRVGVAVLGRRGLSLDLALQESPALARHVAEARRCQQPRSRGAGSLWQRPARRVVGNVLLVGDAAGYVDGLTGDGLGVGFLTSRAALTALEAGDPTSYERRWRLASRRYRALTTAVVLGASVPPLRSVLVPTARAVPSVFQAAVNVLAGDGWPAPDRAREPDSHAVQHQ